jgi:hypothetical protein
MRTLKTVRRNTVTGARTTGALRERALAGPGDVEEATGGKRTGRSAHATPSKARVVPPRRENSSGKIIGREKEVSSIILLKGGMEEEPIGSMEGSWDMSSHSIQKEDLAL